MVSDVGDGTLNLPRDYRFTRGLTTRPLKFTLTGPHMLCKVLTDRRYAQRDELCMGIARVLRRLQLNRMLERGGVMQAVERSGTHLNPTRVVANLTFWLVMFAVILVAANALGLALYAGLCQEAGLVPIVEPEVLMDGAHSLERCRDVTEQVLRSVFEQLSVQHHDARLRL